MLLTFLKLCKWYQIAQRITYEGDKRKSGKGKGSPVISSLFVLSFNAVIWIYFVPVICSYYLTYSTLLFLVNEKLSTRSTINRNICPKVLRRMCSKSASLLKKLRNMCFLSIWQSSSMLWSICEWLLLNKTLQNS